MKHSLSDSINIVFLIEPISRSHDGEYYNF